MLLETSTDAQGIAAAFGTAFCWSMTALFFGAASRRIGQFHVNQIRLVQACLMLGAATAITGAFAPAPWVQLLLLGLSGLVGLTLGDAALFLCLQIMGPRRGSLIMALAPGFAVMLMVPLLGEVLAVDDPDVLGTFLSGAGPSVAAIARAEAASAVERLLASMYARAGVEATVRVLAAHEGASSAEPESLNRLADAAASARGRAV